MKRLITEKASREAFRPMASIRKTALREPNRAPIHRRLPTVMENWDEAERERVLLVFRWRYAAAMQLETLDNDFMGASRVQFYRINETFSVRI